jgi:hypothetical protein
MLPGQKERIEAGQRAELEKVPAQVPTRVVLMIGRDDLFPYRVEYWRWMPGEIKALSLKKPPPVERMILAMELFEVQIDVAIDPRQFIYSPGDLEPTDQTTKFLQSIELKDVAEIKSAAAKSAGRR